MLDGDRRQVDKIMLKSINRLTAVIIPHSQREDERDLEQDRIIKSLGGLEAMTKRAQFVDALILKAGDERQLILEAKRKIMHWGLTGLLVAIGVVLVYYWNGHVPANMQVTTPPRLGG